MYWLQNPFKSPQLSNDHDCTSSGGGSVDGESARGGGVKEDVSTMGESIGRQLRGVAAFLAPPPTSPSQQSLAAPSSGSSTAAASDEPQGEPSSKQTLAGIRSDLEEIGGSFKSSLSLLSTSKAVSGLSKLASSFLQLNEGEEKIDDDEPGVAVTDQVVEFVREISSRPEYWIDFPLSLKDDFNMSDAQAEHASDIEQLVPSFTALREMIMSNMSERKFWMIYFILLLPRLNESEGKLLSTPQIVEARKILLLLLKNKSSEVPDSDKEQINSPSQPDSKIHEKVNEEGLCQEKMVSPLNSTPSLEMNPKRIETTGKLVDKEVMDSQKQFSDEDDFSFSDLEDDDNDLLNRQQAQESSCSSSADGSNDWVRSNENAGTGGTSRAGKLHSQSKRDSDGEESNDWLTIDEFHCDN